MGCEIERKFTISDFPDNLEDYDFHIIEQAYLTTEPVIRVRREDAEYYMTYKKKSDSSMLLRTEYNLPLTKEAYDTLKSKADGNIITKKRVLIPYGDYTIELDIFDGKFKGIVVAEVEFPTIEEAESFVPPVWFKEDVTGVREYTNSYMSRM